MRPFWTAIRIPGRDIFLNRISPQAIANKRLIYHANGGGERLAEALVQLRRLVTEKDFLLQRLMFLKSIETAPLLELLPNGHLDAIRPGKSASSFPG